MEKYGWKTNDPENYASESVYHPGGISPEKKLGC